MATGFSTHTTASFRTKSDGDRSGLRKWLPAGVLTGVEVFLLLFLALLISVAFMPNASLAKSNLPNCPSNQKKAYKNCFGTYKYDGGDKYVGEWKADKRHGNGKYFYSDKSVYDGQWRKGEKHGKGTYTFADGETYVGTFVDGDYNGKGTYSYANGDKYVGEWKADEKSGQGTFFFANGTKYIGEWLKDKRHGKGKYFYDDESTYNGEWIDGEKEGQGTYRFKDGERYVGTFVGGDYNGNGSYFYANGDKYVGGWESDQKSGQGTFTFKSGNKYIGEFKDGKRNGQGSFIFSDGEKFVGTFVDGDYNGFGTYTYKNGDLFEGQWKADKKNGQGTYTFSSGKKYVGEWKDDNYNGLGTLFAADGSVTQRGRFKNDKFVSSEDFTDPAAPAPTGPNVLAKSTLKKCPTDQSARFHLCFGKYTYPKGGIYLGEWKDDKRHGKGTYTFTDGEQYIGEYANDKRIGFGVLTLKSGARYEGAWVNSEQEGFGTYYFADGDIYAGNFKNGKRHGQGTYTHSDGDKYIGEYIKDKNHGHGTYLFEDGDKYVGEFADGKRNGQGTYIFESGKKFVGGFKDGDYHGQGILFAADGSIIEQGRYENDELVAPQTVAVAPTTPAPAVDNSVAIASSGSKVALVIGNQSYTNSTPLKNPNNDARAIAEMLRKMGFTVFSGTDLDKRSFDLTIRDFVVKAEQADIALFYYAGHAVQVAGQNYMVPTDAVVDHPRAIDFELVNMSVVSNYMGGRDKIGIILLDACRDNPFTRSLSRSLGASRSTQVGSGLAPVVSQAGGLLIGFATAPNDVAGDGEGNNSPFATGLLKHLPTPGLEIELAMKRVKAEVIRMTKNGQRPWHNSDLAKEVYLMAN